MRKTVWMIAVLALGSLSGCAAFYGAPVMPPAGMLYSDIKAPVDIDVHGTPVAAKAGRATSTSILGLVAQGDASVNSAAQDGGITKIESIDYEFYNILGVYSKFTTVVYGQ